MERIQSAKGWLKEWKLPGIRKKWKNVELVIKKYYIKSQTQYYGQAFSTSNKNRKSMSTEYYTICLQIELKKKKKNRKCIRIQHKGVKCKQSKFLTFKLSHQEK